MLALCASLPRRPNAFGEGCLRVALQVKEIQRELVRAPITASMPSGVEQQPMTRRSVSWSSRSLPRFPGTGDVGSAVWHNLVHRVKRTPDSY